MSLPASPHVPLAGVAKARGLSQSVGPWSAGYRGCPSTTSGRWLPDGPSSPDRSRQFSWVRFGLAIAD